MRLAEGSPAPDFTAEVWSGERLQLSGLRGGKLWLAFFRYASCPLCNLQVHQVIERWEQLQAAGLQVVAVFQSPASSISEYVGKQAPPFPLLCDPEERLYELYGLESSLAGFMSPANAGNLARASAKGFLPGRMEGTKTRLPADFLIDERGVIQRALYARVIGEHMAVDEVLDLVLS